MNKEAEKIRHKEMQREMERAEIEREMERAESLDKRRREAQEAFERDLEKRLRGMKKAELREYARALACHNRELKEQRNMFFRTLTENGFERSMWVLFVQL